MANPLSPIPPLPTDKHVVDKNGKLMPEWERFFDQLISSLSNVFSSEGFQMPSQVTHNISLLTGLASVGRLLNDNTDPDNTILKINLNVSGTPTWKTVATL